MDIKQIEAFAKEAAKSIKTESEAVFPIKVDYPQTIL